MESLRETICWPGWEIVRTLGSGGFGKVYEIRKADETGEYRAAMKVIRIPNAPSDYEVYVDDGYDEESITAIFKSQMEDIAREFSLMAQFKGVSNIVSYEEHLIIPHEDGRGWDILIRMELLTSLPQYCREHALTEKEIIRLGMDICRALELCGKKKVIHRDIKPQNLFVNDFGDFKLGDFGISKTLDHTTKATKTGTSSYMAPEVYNGQAYGSSVDIYSLGLVLYWLLNERRLPFMPMGKVPSHSEMERAVERRYKGEQFTPPKNGSQGLKNIVMRACAYNPQDRFASPEEMREALDNVLHGQPAPVRPVVPVSEPTPKPVQKRQEVPATPVAKPAYTPTPEPVLLYDEVEDDDGGTVGGAFYRPPVEVHTPAPEPVHTPTPEPEPALLYDVVEDDDGGTVGGAFYRPPVEVHTPAPEPVHTPTPEPEPWYMEEDEEKTHGKDWSPSSQSTPRTDEQSGKKTVRVTAAKKEISYGLWEAVLVVISLLLCTVHPFVGVGAGIIGGGILLAVYLKNEKASSYEAAAEDTPDACATFPISILDARKYGQSLCASGELTAVIQDGGGVLCIHKTQQKLAEVWEKLDIKELVVNTDGLYALLESGKVVELRQGETRFMPWGDVEQISAYGRTVAGVRNNGSVVCNNESYDLSQWKGIRRIAVGKDCVAALRMNGTVVTAGKSYSQSWENMSSVAVGGKHMVGLSYSRKVLVVGDCMEGQNLTGIWFDIVAVAAGYKHTVGLKGNGQVVATGDNTYGQCNVYSWKNIVAIGAGDNFTVGLKADGTLVMTGANTGADGSTRWKYVRVKK